MTILIYVALIIIFLGAWLLLPQFMTRRAARQVIRIFQRTQTVNEKSARTAQELGLAQKPFFSIAQFGSRDWKPKALQVLIEAKVVLVTPEGKVYLDEDQLQKTNLVKHRP